MDNVYEIIVDRKIRNRFLVLARSSAEAAMKLGAGLAGPAPFSSSEGHEVERRMQNPRIVKGAGPQQVLDFEAGLAGAEPDENGIRPEVEP